jgi:hypothetical protein
MVSQWNSDISRSVCLSGEGSGSRIDLFRGSYRDRFFLEPMDSDDAIPRGGWIRVELIEERTARIRHEKLPVDVVDVLGASERFWRLAMCGGVDGPTMEI